MTTPFMLSAILMLFSQLQVKPGTSTPEVGVSAPPWIALALLWLFLSLLNEKISVPFAWLIFVGMLYVHGKPVLRTIGNVGKKGN